MKVSRIILSVKQLSTSGKRTRFRWSLLRQLLCVVHNGFALALVILVAAWGTSHVLQSYYSSTMLPLLQHYRNKASRSASNATQRDSPAVDRTYFERHCHKVDLTLDSNNEKEDDWIMGEPHRQNPMDASESILRHGIVVVPTGLKAKTARRARQDTLRRNAVLTPEDRVYVHNAFGNSRKSRKLNQKLRRNQPTPNATRWSFRVDPYQDDEWREIWRELYFSSGPDEASSSLLLQTLEALLGPNPAVIKIQTITVRNGAVHQPWHADLTAHGSGLLYARQYTAHLSVFVPLQDTTPSMGSTGVCPGSQYCATLSDSSKTACGQIHSYNSTIWRTGDALIMNQNTIHRGWQHTQPPGKHKVTMTDRVILVMTFVPRPRQGRLSSSVVRQPPPSISLPDQQQQQEDLERWIDEDVELRMLSLGTPLSSFGLTMEDFRRVATHNPLLPRHLFQWYQSTIRHWGWTEGWSYPTVWFGRVASENHLFLKQDLADWIRQNVKQNVNSTRRDSRSSQKADNKVKEKSSTTSWLWSKAVSSGVTSQFLHNQIPAQTNNRAIWDLWYEKSIRKTERVLYEWCRVIGAAYFVVAVLVALSTWASGNGKERQQSLLHYKCLGGCLVLVGLCIGMLYQTLQQLSLTHEVRSGNKFRLPLPPSYSNHSFSKKMGQPTDSFVHPMRLDVIEATRSHSPHLRPLFARYIDYHSGNYVWYREGILPFSNAADCHAIFGAPTALHDALVSYAINSVAAGRFLRQCPQTGRYAIMTDPRPFVRRVLMTRCSPQLWGRLDQWLAYALAFWRFDSTLRESALASCTVNRLEQLRDSIFEQGVVDQEPHDLHSVRRPGMTFIPRPQATINPYQGTDKQSRNPIPGLWAPSRYVADDPGVTRQEPHTQTIKPPGRHRPPKLSAKQVMAMSQRRRQQRGNPRQVK